MKTVIAFTLLLFAGCTTVPKKLYVQPEKFNCDLLIPTSWNGDYPVKFFEHKLIVSQTYEDYNGMSYKLMPTEDPNVFSLQIVVPSP